MRNITHIKATESLSGLAMLEKDFSSLSLDEFTAVSQKGEGAGMSRNTYSVFGDSLYEDVQIRFSELSVTAISADGEVCGDDAK